MFKRLTIWPLYKDQVLIIKDNFTGSLQKIDNPYSITTKNKIYLENKIQPEESRSHFVYKIFKKKKIEHEKWQNLIFTPDNSTYFHVLCKQNRSDLLKEYMQLKPQFKADLKETSPLGICMEHKFYEQASMILKNYLEDPS